SSMPEFLAGGAGRCRRRTPDHPIPDVIYAHATYGLKLLTWVTIRLLNADFRAGTDSGAQ
ncbi:MAG: hypothetical protein ABSE80_13655, partial [Halobacteriota archaeon]